MASYFEENFSKADIYAKAAQISTLDQRLNLIQQFAVPGAAVTQRQILAGRDLLHSPRSEPVYPR